MTKRNRTKERKKMDTRIPLFKPTNAFDDPSLSAYLTAIEIKEQKTLSPTNFKICEEIASTLFFDGGKLSDHNKQALMGDRPIFNQALQSMLRSSAPPHEIKIGTCAVMLMQYTEDIVKENGKG